MNKKLVGKEISSIVKSLIHEHVRVYFNTDDSNVTVGLVTGAGDIFLNAKPYKFMVTYNFRNCEIKVMNFDNEKREDD